MATNLDDLTVIRTRFFALWPSATIVLLDNDTNTAQPKTLFARLSIQPGAQRRLSIASKTYEQLGRVYLQIFVPSEQGTRVGFELAETFTNIFRDWSSADYRVRFDTPEYRTSEEEKAYFTILCSVPYTARH